MPAWVSLRRNLRGYLFARTLIVDRVVGVGLWVVDGRDFGSGWGHWLISFLLVLVFGEMRILLRDNSMYIHARLTQIRRKPRIQSIGMIKRNRSEKEKDKTRYKNYYKILVR